MEILTRIKGFINIALETVDRYSDVAYLFLFPHLVRSIQFVLFFTLLLPVNFVIVFFYLSLYCEQGLLSEIKFIFLLYFRIN